MKNYTRFDRHQNMNDETRSEILNIIRELWRDDVTSDQRINIENSLYGLFDGYLYTDLILEVQVLPLDLYERIVDIYFICKGYKVSLKCETV